MAWLIMWSVLAGSFMIVNVEVAVAVLPSSPVAVTLAVYFCPYRRACIGTHVDPSGRGPPSTFAPLPALVTSTVAFFAFFVWYAISTDAGTSVAASFGSVIVAATLPPSLVLPLAPDPFQCDDGVLVQATRPSTSTSATAAALRRVQGAGSRM